MTLDTIKNTLDTDKACREHLASIRWRYGYICPVCKCRESWVTSEIKYKCKNCGHKQSVTSGTLLQDSHIPLNKWFLAIWLFSSYGNRITAKVLNEELSFGNLKPAQRILKVLRSINVEKNPEKLGNTVEMIQDGIYYKGTYHPILIAAEVLDRSILQIRIQEVPCRDKKHILDFVRRNIQPSSPTITELSQNQKSATSGIITELLTQDEMGDIFRKIIKRETYRYRYSDRILSKFRSWLSEQRNDNDFAQMCDRFCVDYNRKFYTASFEELLEYLITEK